MGTEIDRERIIDALEEWSSEAEQQRLWLSTGENGAEVSSFNEAREQLFTDTRLGDQLDRSRRVFGDPVDEGLSKLHALIGRIDAYRSPAEIISDARMGEVRALAARLIEQLRN